MKSRMKKIVSTKSLPAFVLATTLLFLLGTALATVPAMDTVSGTGSSQLDIENPPPPGVIMQFRGEVKLLVRGEPKTTELVVNVYSVLENEEGVRHVSASHILTFGDGSTIITTDMEVAEPADNGVYTLNGNLDVTSGTGVYEGVSGQLTAHGTMDFSVFPYEASFTLRGAISSPATE